MYAAVMLFVSMCLTATTLADHHQPCHSPNMTGHMSVLNLKGELKANGVYTYDSLAKKLRFRSNETEGYNTSLTLDVLMFFEEGVFYEIDSKNQSCEKKSLQSVHNPLEIPSDAKFLSTITIGSVSIEGEGLKVNVWMGTVPETKAHYSISSTMGCLPVSALFFLDSTTVLFSNLQVETEIKDPDLLTLPSFCEGEPLEETPEGTVNSFTNLFI
ncbi:ependymin [Centroberyx affinis]|uniref:ependymin n=1 Tax=Centroberyx affinis TaxID=166261 RepID=UPI003A5C209A